MSEIDEDFSRTSSLSLHRSSGGEENAQQQPLLIPLNARNSNSSRVGSEIGSSAATGRAVSAESSSVDNAGSVNNNERRFPVERGATSMNPRSKRPKPQPSAAILEAKRNAIANAKRNQAVSNPQHEIAVVMKDHLQAVLLVCYLLYFLIIRLIMIKFQFRQERRKI